MLNAHAMPTYRGQDVQAADTHNQIFLSSGKSSVQPAPSSQCNQSATVAVKAPTPIPLFFVIRPVLNKGGFILCCLPWGEEGHENIVKTHGSIFI